MDSMTTYRKQRIERMIDKYPLKMCKRSDYVCQDIDDNGYLKCGSQWCKDKLKDDFKDMQYKITRRRG